MNLLTSKDIRRKYFCDRAVQGGLLLHVVGHWLMFLFTAAGLLLFIEMLSGDPRDAWPSMVQRHGPTMLAALVLAPIFIRDLCKLTNRFAGPMVRLRRAMHDLAEGDEVDPIQFRDGDFWKELATDFNRVLERVQNSNTIPSHCQSDADRHSHADTPNPASTETEFVNS